MGDTNGLRNTKYMGHSIKQGASLVIIMLSGLFVGMVSS